MSTKQELLQQAEHAFKKAEERLNYVFTTYEARSARHWVLPEVICQEYIDARRALDGARASVAVGSPNVTGEPPAGSAGHQKAGVQHAVDTALRAAGQTMSVATDQIFYNDHLIAVSAVIVLKKLKELGYQVTKAVKPPPFGTKCSHTLLQRYCDAKRVTLTCPHCNTVFKPIRLKTKWGKET